MILDERGRCLCCQVEIIFFFKFLFSISFLRLQSALTHLIHFVYCGFLLHLYVVELSLLKLIV